jgi:hypothetical protein
MKNQYTLAPALCLLLFFSQTLFLFGQSFQLDVQKTSPTCSGSSNGSITVNIIGPSGNYTISLKSVFSQDEVLQFGTTNTGSITFNNLKEGFYQIVASRNDNNCETIHSDELLFANEFDGFSVGQERLTCAPCNVEATVFPYSAASYTYQWSTGATTPSVSGLCDGVYSVTVTNTQTNCVMQKNFEVVTDQANFPYELVVPFSVCEGVSSRYFLRLPESNTGKCVDFDVNTIEWTIGGNTLFGDTIDYTFDQTGFEAISVTIPALNLTLTTNVLVNKLVDYISAMDECEPLTMSFTPMLNCVGNGINPDDFIYQWNFGDPASGSNTDEGFTVEHTFSDPGTYVVTLKVFIPGETEPKYELTMEVTPKVSPFENLEIYSFSNQCVDALERTFFVNSVFCNFDSVLWNFGDPASGVNNFSNELFPQHNFSSPGSYNISVTFFSVNSPPSGYTSSTTISVNSPPVLPEFPLNVTLLPNQSVLIGPPSSDSLFYSWSHFVFETPTSVDKPGEYVLEARRIGNYADCPARKSVKVNYCGNYVLDMADINTPILKKVWPNPVRKGEMLSFSSVADTDYSLVDVTGRIIAQGKCLADVTTIKIASLSEGVYFLKYRADGATIQTSKVLIAN